MIDTAWMSRETTMIVRFLLLSACLTTTLQRVLTTTNTTSSSGSNIFLYNPRIVHVVVVLLRIISGWCPCYNSTVFGQLKMQDWKMLNQHGPVFTCMGPLKNSTSYRNTFCLNVCMDVHIRVSLVSHGELPVFTYIACEILCQSHWPAQI